MHGNRLQCRSCSRLWKEAFPKAPPGCYLAGQELEPPSYFDLKTGLPRECKAPEPDVLNPTAARVLEVLAYCSSQMMGEGGGLSIEAALTVAEKLPGGPPIDEFFLDLWHAASDELGRMRAEMIRQQLEEARLNR